MSKKKTSKKEPKYNTIEHLGPRLDAIEVLENLEIPFWVHRNLPHLRISGSLLYLDRDGDAMTRLEAIKFFEEMIQALQID